MDFIEEKTPGGYIIKIMFKKWQFIAFDNRGKSVYVNPESTSPVCEIPLIFFVGKKFYINEDYTRDYHILKIRKGTMILPYTDLNERSIKYIFIEKNFTIDAIPVRIKIIRDIATMIREIDIKMKPDYVIVDESITENDIIIIRSRYKAENIIHIVKEKPGPDEQEEPEAEKDVNINMMSTNPVFLARIHLRAMDLSKVNQLLLDFDLTALDAEYIVNFIDSYIEEPDDSQGNRNRAMLIELRNAFEFYLHLLQRNDQEIRTMIESQVNLKKLAPFRTLVSKVKSIYPNREEQLLYTEYENIIMDKRQELQEKGSVQEKKKV
ncbi:MAG: hypothetical protein CVV44_11750 [Spirochaetae bacterium HGW-Spirochaetae-1]|jgi:hypothetical protein|nr:MAG: hypothetical protein CVV44_11750 [Spirochaetae bacterium HGW-Spirochaetae-1]